MQIGSKAHKFTSAWLFTILITILITFQSGCRFRPAHNTYTCDNDLGSISLNKQNDGHSARMATSMTTAGILLPDWLYWKLPF